MLPSNSRDFRIRLQFLDVRKVIWIAQKVDERVSNIQKLVFCRVSIIIQFVSSLPHVINAVQNIRFASLRFFHIPHVIVVIQHRLCLSFHVSPVPE